MLDISREGEAFEGYIKLILQATTEQGNMDKDQYNMFPTEKVIMQNNLLKIGGYTVSAHPNEDIFYTILR